MSLTTTDGSLERLRGLISAEGGELAAVVTPVGAVAVFGPLAALGPRTRTLAEDYGVVLEAVLEGYLVHFATPRLVSAEDPDLRLLAGDFLYALGLARLAQLGDLEAVAELGDLITLCAQAHAEGRAARAPGGEPVTSAVWALSALAVMGGRWPEHERELRAVREGAPDASTSGLAAAARRADELAIGPDLQRALIAFKGTFSSSFPTT